MEEKLLLEEINKINSHNNGIKKKIESLNQQIEHLKNEEEFIKKQLIQMDFNNEETEDTIKTSIKKENKINIEENKLLNNSKNKFIELNKYVMESVSKRSSVEFSFSKLKELPFNSICVKTLKFDENFLLHIDKQYATTG